MTSLLGATTPSLVLLKNPRGTWHFAGTVPWELSYEMKDGSPITAEAKQTISHCGPGFANVRGKTWPTKEEAIEAAAKVGAKITQVIL